MTVFLTILAALIVGVVSLYAVLYWLARRRRTPNWQLACDSVPPIENIMPTLAGLTGSPTYAGNQVEILVNGAIFEPMLKDISQARHTVHLETFVWRSGTLERRFADALLAAAARGVAVRLTVDGVGAMNRTDGILQELEKGGVHVHVYSPLTLWSLHRFNERTHRKLLILDGCIAYTMGHGISDQWLGDGDDKEQYRDTGVRVLGPGVHGLQAVFAAGWARQTCELLCGEAVFPALSRVGDSPLAVVSSVSGDSYSSVELAFLLAIGAAEREILIQNPYFAPDNNVVDNLCDAAARGVDVTLMLPGRATDSNLLRVAAQHLYPKLVAAGIRLLEYTPTLSHQKVMIVDEVFSRVGSTNLDCRSLELNAEAGVAIFDPDIAGRLREQFHHDAKLCRRVTSSELKQCSLLKRIQRAGAYLLHGQL